MRMRSERIVEAIDVRKKTSFQLIERLIRTSVGFFLLKIFEEAFDNGVIVGMPLSLIHI